MASKQIKDLNAVSAVTGTDRFALDDALDATYKATGAQILTYIQSATAFSDLNNTPTLVADYAIFSSNSDHTALIESGVVTSADGDINIPLAGEFQINSVNINTAGTLSNVAYLNQQNIFTAMQRYSAHPNFTVDTQIVDKKYVDDNIGGVDEFSELIDVVGAYTVANALYKTNAVIDGLIETSTTLDESVANQFGLTRGTTTFVAKAAAISITGLTNDRVMISSAGDITESSTITTAELGLLDGMVSVSTGVADNDKLVTQGYVDDNSGGGFWQRVTTTLSPVNAGDDLDMGAGGNITAENITASAGYSFLVGANRLKTSASGQTHTVGATAHTDFSTITAALSSITTPSETDRHLIKCATADSNYYTEDVVMDVDPYVNVSMMSGRLDGYIRIGEVNALYLDEIYSAGDGDSGLIKSSGTDHSYVFINKIRAGGINSRSCTFSNEGQLDLFAHYLYVGNGTGIGGDPVSAESSSGDVNAFVNHIKMYKPGDVLGNAVCAQDNGITAAYLNRIDSIGTLKSIYRVNDANTGLYSDFNFSQTDSYILNQAAGYACIRGGYADGSITVTGNYGTWLRLNRQGNSDITISGVGSSVNIDVLDTQADVDVQNGAALYLDAQKLAGTINTNSGVGKLVCNIADWTGTFTTDKTNVNGFIGVYGDSKMYLYGHNFHCNPLEITNAHYRANTRLTLEDSQCHAQFIAEDDGGAWGSYLMLSTAPGTGDNKHWLVHHSGSSQSDEFKLEYGTSVDSATFSLSEKFMLSTAGKPYFPGFGTLSGQADVQFNTTTKEVGYVSSALRGKTNITNMEDTSWIYELRPVNFERKDAPGVKQYGLIAEEVEKINAALCGYSYIQESYIEEERVKDKKTGKITTVNVEKMRNTSEKQIETVSYTTLIPPMLHAMQLLKARVEVLENK